MTWNIKTHWDLKDKYVLSSAGICLLPIELNWIELNWIELRQDGGKTWIRINARLTFLQFENLQTCKISGFLFKFLLPTQSYGHVMVLVKLKKELMTDEVSLRTIITATPSSEMLQQTDFSPFSTPFHLIFSLHIVFSKFP